MILKRLLTTAVVAMAISSPVMAHHAAEGIVSDDIWLMIDDMLAAADSPHLNLDFDDVMGSMAVTSVGGTGGDMALVTTITVRTEDADEYMVYVDTAVDAAQRVPQGSTAANPASGLFVEVVDLENGFTEITLYEPIGSGESQDDPATPSPGSGPR